jgi:hypothetical protein
MLKVFATECLWRIINDTIQIFGGKAYFTDEPYERMLRDARINTIGEGANDVLRVFTAAAGMRDVGLQLKGVLDALLQPAGNLGQIGRFASRKLGSMLSGPEVSVRHYELEEEAADLARLVRSFGGHVERTLVRHREAVLDRQCLLGRVADAATEVYVSACVLARLDRMLDEHGPDEHERTRQITLGRSYLRSAARRIRRNLAELTDNDDAAIHAAAEAVLGAPGL